MAKTHFIRVFGHIDVSMAEKIKKRLLEVESGSVIIFLFSSKGGELHYARVISAAMQQSAREKDLYLVAVAYEHVYSAAVRIFLTCHLRVGLTTANFLIHPPRNISSNGIDLEKVAQEEADFISKATDLSRDETLSLMKKESYLDVSQAQDFGICNSSY